MNTYIVSLLMAFTAGVFAATQGAINAFIGKSTGQFIMIIGVSLVQALSAVFFLLRSGGTLPLHMIRGLSSLVCLAQALCLVLLLRLAALGRLPYLSCSFLVRLWLRL